MVSINNVSKQDLVKAVQTQSLDLRQNPPLVEEGHPDNLTSPGDPAPPAWAGFVTEAEEGKEEEEEEEQHERI